MLLLFWLNYCSSQRALRQSQVTEWRLTLWLFWNEDLQTCVMSTNGSSSGFSCTTKAMFCKSLTFINAQSLVPPLCQRTTCPNSFIQWFAQLHWLSKLCRPWWTIQSVIQYQTHKIRNIYNAYTVLCAVEFSRVFLALQRNVTVLALGSVCWCLCGFAIMDSGHCGRERGAARCSTLPRCPNQTVSPPAPIELLLKHDRGLNVFIHFRKTKPQRTNLLLSHVCFTVWKGIVACAIY